MPCNTSLGVLIGALSTVLGFALVWHIWWLAIASLLTTVAALIVRSYDRHTEYYVTAEEVERVETQRRQLMAEA